LTTLSGAPTIVLDNFDCSDNALEDLSGAPAEVGGNFICFGNPKAFSKKDIEAVCKVGGKIILKQV